MGGYMIRKLLFTSALSILFLLPQYVLGQANITDFSPYWKHKYETHR